MQMHYFSSLEFPGMSLLGSSVNRGDGRCEVR
jgi:hypothetical protein